MSSTVKPTAPVESSVTDDAAVAQLTHGMARSNLLRTIGWIVGVAILLLICLLSLSVGAKSIPFGTVWDALFAFDGSQDHLVVRDMRLPRTALGLVAGAALGVAGALIQALTRNPLADPGILGVNAGAAFMVALAVGTFGITGLRGYIWFAFAGAILATLIVYAIGSWGRGGGTPVRLTLAGVAIAAVLGGVTQGLVLLDPVAFDAMRTWNAGSIAGRDGAVVWAILPFI
ncbi:MAG: iron chelate uptake ABC transporter family permease subunit, partial [Gordonia amarae]